MCVEIKDQKFFYEEAVAIYKIKKAPDFSEASLLKRSEGKSCIYAPLHNDKNMLVSSFSLI